MIGRMPGDFYFPVTCHLSLVTLTRDGTRGIADPVSRNL